MVAEREQARHELVSVRGKYRKEVQLSCIHYLVNDILHNTSQVLLWLWKARIESS